MSYYNEAIKDAPKALFMLDGTVTNSSGIAISSGLTGTLAYGAPLVSGASKSTQWGASSYIGVGFPLMQPGTERQPFTLETWFMPLRSGTTMNLATNASTYDGLFWNGATLTFNLRLGSTPYYTGISYTPTSFKSMHVVGVYTGTALQLYVDGERVGEYTLTEFDLLQPINPVSATSAIYQGVGVGLTNGLATYYNALTAEQIKNHYVAGTDTLSKIAASSLNNGIYEKVDLSATTTFGNRLINTQEQFEDADYTCTVLDRIESLTDESGAFLDSMWQTAIPLTEGGATINGMKLSWQGEGSYTISTSVDGDVWVVVNRNDTRVATITPGFDGTDKYLFVRVEFAEASYGRINRIETVGYVDGLVKTSKRPITISESGTLYPDKPIISHDEFNGVRTNLLKFDPSPDGEPVYGLGFWYLTTTTPLIVSGVTPDAYYENGEPIGVRTVTNRWVYAFYVFPATTGAITIYGDTISIVAPTLYDTTVTAVQVKEIYQSYTGYPVLRVDCPTAISPNTPQADIYANDWSITSVA